MRYWVYQDSRILGPFNKEELSSVEGIHPTSLVCPDGQTGTKEMDWVQLDNIEELGVVFGAAADRAHQVGSLVGSFDQFAKEAHASLEKIGTSENWMESIQSDPRLSDLWGSMPGDIGPEKNWELHQNADLESRFAQLQAKLEIQERRQNEILDRLGEKDKQLADKDKTINELRAKLDSGTASAPFSQTPQAEDAAPPTVEMVPFEDDMEVPAPVSRHEPVESGDAVSTESLSEPISDLDAPMILDETDAAAAPPLEEAPAPAFDGIPGLEETPALDAAPSLEEVPAVEAIASLEEAPTMDDAPALDVAPGLEDVPVMEEPVAQAPAVDELGIPEATPLKSVSEMPSVEEFTPPPPDEAQELLPPAGDFPAMDASPDVPSQEMPSLEAPPLDAPPLDAPPLDMPMLDAAPLDAPPLEAPPLEDALGPAVMGGDAPPFQMSTATPETIDLSAPAAEPIMAENVVPPAGDDPFAAPKTLMMGGSPTPMPAIGDAPPELVGGMPPGMEGPPGSTPMPIPLGEAEPGVVGTPPPTPMPSMGQPDLPQTVMAGLGVSGLPTPMPTQNPTPAPGSGFQDMMGGMGAPTPLPAIPGAQPEQTGSPPTMVPTAATPVPGAMVPAASAPAAVAAPEGAKVSAAGELKSKMGKLGGKKFLIGLVIAVLILTGLLFKFFSNPKEIAKMAAMSPEQKTPGSFDVQSTKMGPGGPPPRQKVSPLDQAPAATQVAPVAETNQGAQPRQSAPQFAPRSTPRAAPQPTPRAVPVVKTTPPPATPPRRAFIRDQRIEAMEFVKGYRIGGGKEVIAQKLQYYFMGGDNLPEWQAGALEKNKWIVEYHVFQSRGGGRRKKPKVTYQFEVDLAAKTVKGLNARARAILTSGPRKRSSSRSGRATRRQAPLPSEDQLDNPSSRQRVDFNNPAE